MGFPSVCYCVILPQPLVPVLHLLDLLRRAVLLSLSALGLAAPDDHPASPADHPANLWAPPTPAPPLADVSAVKARLPAVLYADLARRGGGDGALCAVCLGALEPWHRVRALANCAHAFHRACIDEWVEKCRATCPLCRAAVLPLLPPADDDDDDDDDDA